VLTDHVVEGILTVGFASIAALILLNFSASTKWLTKEEREYAVARLVEDNNSTVAGDISHSRSIILAVKDWS